MLNPDMLDGVLKAFGYRTLSISIAATMLVFNTVEGGCGLAHSWNALGNLCDASSILVQLPSQCELKDRSIARADKRAALEIQVFRLWGGRIGRTLRGTPRKEQQGEQQELVFHFFALTSRVCRRLPAAPLRFQG